MAGCIGCERRGMRRGWGCGWMNEDEMVVRGKSICAYTASLVKSVFVSSTVLLYDIPCLYIPATCKLYIHIH